MEDIDRNFINTIIEKLKERLGRNLTKEEFNVFTLQRSLLAYEMILDFISDNKESAKEIELYVRKVIEENK